MVFNGLHLENLEDHEVLFFIRIRGKKSYFNDVYGAKFLSLFKSVKSYRCISEYSKDADFHIDLNSVPRDYLYEHEYNALIKLSSIDEIIKRCRGLRAISYEEASKLIARAYLFFEKFYDTHRHLKLVVTGAIDNYVMDLMVSVGESKGVHFIGLTGSLMSPEYQLSTVRGELSDWSNVDADEMDAFKDKIISNINGCGVPSLKKLIFSNLYNYASYHYRFVVRYLFKYKLLNRLEYEYRFAPFLYGFKSIKQIFAAFKYLKDDEHVFSKQEKKVYIPLHWYPEATTDYWMHSLYHVEYLASVLNTVRLLQEKGYTVYAKEHPHFLLARESSFYKALKEQGCLLISPFVCTKKMFDQMDLVVVWNGSTGIEALLFNKTVYKVVNSYYGDGLIPDLNSSVNLNESVETDAQKIAEKCIEKVYKSSFRVS